MDTRGPGISFELNVTQHFQLNNLKIALDASAIDWLVDVYIRPGGVQSTAGVLPVIDAANGWIKLSENSITPGFPGVPISLDSELDTVLLPGIYGVFISSTDYSSSAGIRSWTNGSVSSFTDGIATIASGPDKGYRGTAPSVFTFDTVLFVGSVVYTPFIPTSNDAAVFSIDSPVFQCSGAHPVSATIGNLGSNFMNNVTVNWSVDGTLQTPVLYNLPIDTIGGMASYKAEVSLGNVTLIENQQHEIKVWTSSPNGSTDPNTTNDTMTRIVETAVNGVFTINPLGSGSTNFLTMQDAADFLMRRGLCGPVVFNIEPGVHTGQAVFGEIQGTSATNTITIQPNPQNTTAVELNYVTLHDSDNYVLKLKGCDYVTIQNLTLSNGGAAHSTAIQFTNNAQHITVNNCRFIGSLVTSAERDHALLRSYSSGDNSYHTIQHNYFYGGSYAMVYRGISPSIPLHGMQIVDNEIVDPYYMGLQADFTNGLQVRKNRIFSSLSPTVDSYGMKLFRADNGLQLTGNEVGGAGSFPTYGIMIDFSVNSPLTPRGLVANNMIHAGSPTSTSINITALGVRFSTFMDILYNTAVSEGASGASKVVDFSGALNRVFNNNFLHYGVGLAVTVPTTGFTWDYNNIATAGVLLGFNPNFGRSIRDFAHWQLIGNGANSINVDSIYTNLDSLRTCDARINGKGNWLANVQNDIDGEVRNISTAPDIGADEFDITPALISIGDTIELCSGGPVELKELIGNVKYGHYTWSTSETTPTIEVTTEGTYTLDIQVCGTSTDSVEVIDVTPIGDFDFDSSADDLLVEFTSVFKYGTTYSWDFGDGSTSTDANPSHQYAAKGTYIVSLTITNDCGTVTLEQEVAVPNYVGIEGSSLDEQLSIYPNPTTGTFNLSVKGQLKAENIQLTLLNMTGQVVSHHSFNLGNGDTETIDVSQFEKGIYMIQVSVETEIVMKRLVIQ